MKLSQFRLNMALTSGNIRRLLSRSIHQISSDSGILLDSIRAAVESKAYDQIPELLDSSNCSSINPNPFSFLSTLSEPLQIQVIDEILQTFIPICPRSRPLSAYSSLLFYTLENPNLLSLSLALVQRTLRSGCIPPPQAHALLSKAWMNRHRRSNPISGTLTEMHSFGYSPDSGTCNYLISSLCKNDQIEEAVNVLKGMQRARCIPNSESYSFVINHMSNLGRANDVVRMVNEMVCVHRLSPRKDTILKAVGAMRVNGDVSKCIEFIESLENEVSVDVGFEVYESVLEGCVEARRWILAGKIAVKMAGKGLIPYIRMRRMVVEGLVSVGEVEFASVVRQKLAEMKS